MTAKRGERVLGGEVRVDAGAPPRALRVEVRDGGRELAMVFDERIDPAGAKARLESGAAVEGLRAGERATALVVTLAEPLTGPDTLVVEGVTDRAAEPHAAPPQRLPVEVALWPGRGDAPVFVYATDGAPILARDVDSGHERAFGVVPRGRARYDAHGALRAVHGWFEAEDLPKGFAGAFRKANAFTLEVTAWPASKSSDDPRTLVSFGADESSQNFRLFQRGEDLILRIRASEGKREHGEEKFGHLESGKPNHLLVSYRPGRLVAYQDGHAVFETDAIHGDLSGWRDGVRLVLGADPSGEHDFRGTLEGVALYPHFFESEEAAAHANAYLDGIAKREPVPRVVVKGRLTASSVLPTPEQVAPYREALVLNEYEVPEKKRERIGASRLRVAHWAILDGHSQPVPAASNGRKVKLRLEPWESYPRLESLYLSDTLDPDVEIPIYLDVTD